MSPSVCGWTRLFFSFSWRKEASVLGNAGRKWSASGVKKTGGIRVMPRVHVPCKVPSTYCLSHLMHSNDSKFENANGG